MEYLQDNGRISFEPYTNAKVAIFAGAGLSAESGLSTFRDVDGLWTKYDTNKVCNYNTYFENKDEVLEFYNEVKLSIAKAEPNAGHFAIAKLQQQFPDKILITTSNIDDLLERAGCTNVLHVHGDCSHLSCRNCFHRLYIGDRKFEIPDDLACTSCGRIKKLKPGVVFFGENAPAYEPLFNGFANETIKHRVLIGSTLKVNRPESFSLDLEGTSYYIDQNPNTDAIPSVDHVIIGTAVNKLPDFFEKLALTIK